MQVYLDNAATTPIDSSVAEAMVPWLFNHFGNPSSIHQHGRQAKAALEKARKKIAELLNCAPGEIFFTSGGTEADNTAICSTILTKGIKHAITSEVEHHAVLHTLQNLANDGKIILHVVDVDHQGAADLNHLQTLLSKYPEAMVSLMHANNEVATLNDLEAIGTMTHASRGYFHTDTVQGMGHFRYDLNATPVDFVVGAAHKFHGPKGVGFLYVDGRNKIAPFIHGGAQERNMRGGTENVYGIIGMAHALELAYTNLDANKAHIKALKAYMIAQLQQHIEGVAFNGASADIDNSLYTVLSVSLPPSEANDMLLFSLDIEGVSASGGSACSSGSSIGSHVLNALNAKQDRGYVRFSFSKFNTFEEIDYTVAALCKILQTNSSFQNV